MIVTGPLSMNLSSEIAHELSNGETNGIGMRLVDVGERGEFTHEWILLDDEEELYEHAVERCISQATRGDDARVRKNSLFASTKDALADLEVSPLEAMKWHSTDTKAFHCSTMRTSQVLY